MPKVGPLRVHLYFTSLRDVSPSGFLDMEGDTFQIDDQATLIEAESREAAPAAQGQARTGPENLLGSIPCPQQKTLCQRLVSLVAGTLPYIRKKI